MEIEIFEVEAGRYGYRVGGVYQEWHPEREGFVAMTEEEARRCAEIVAARMQG